MTQISLPTTGPSWLDAFQTSATPAALDKCDHRHYRIGPMPVSLRTDVPGVKEEFHSLYHRYETPSPPRHEFHVSVIARRSWRTLRRHYHIFGDGEETSVVHNIPSILPHVEWALNGLIMRYLPDYLQIHASVMSYQGVGVIFAGDPGHGKSTLSASLLTRGWSYLSDEFALIDPHRKLLVPYPKALCIKAGSFEALSRIGMPFVTQKIYHKGKKGWVTLINPFDVRDNPVSEPCRVGMVVLPEYHAEQKPKLEPISGAQAVFHLTRYAFNFTKFRTKGIELLANVVRDAKCYRLWTNDLNATSDLLEAEMRTVRL